ncbi:MAG TPA: hypothetical protein DCX14_08360 [Flavobacteriales bacterium]|nr:hypothetical protein [Flavobacteriales bacterium]
MNLLEIINAEIAEMSRKQAEVSLFEEELNKSFEKMPRKKRGRPPKVSNEIFVDIWISCIESGGLQEIAHRLGISTACAAVKASNMRKKGYDLPFLKRGRPRKVEQ